MMQHMADSVEYIYLALGYTDFRRQINGLTAMVALQFKMDPYSGTTLFLFCNKRHTAIKALRWDGNGFQLATKCLANDMKFQWPKTQGELIREPGQNIQGTDLGAEQLNRNIREDHKKDRG